MSYPFPGMNPWLENPAVWHSIHQRLITGLADSLSPILRPRYFVDIETHTYIAIADDKPQIRYPDVAIINRGGPPVLSPAADEAPYLTIDLPLSDPIEESFLEVKSVPTGEVVTIIEILSHTNKINGKDRQSYFEKREAILESLVHFVEIDLLRAHAPMLYTEEAQSDYRLFIRRSEKRRRARLYPFSLRQSIPAFPLPLRPDDQEPTVDLGSLLHQIYDRAGYDLVIKYDQPPAPPLGDADSAWAAEFLKQPL